MMPVTMVVKPCLNTCNIKCDYCYHNWLKSSVDGLTKRMTTEMVDVILQNLSSLPQQKVRMIWHGGEPLLAGKEFFAYVLDRQEKFPGKFINLIQTNGILLDSDWIKILKRGRFNVGISMDGYEQLHNMLRKDKFGKGTFSDVMRGVKLLQSENVEVGTISVITKHNYRYASQIFDFLCDNQLLKMNFSPCADSYLPYHLSPVEWAEFLLEIFECWLEKDDPIIKIIPLDSFVHSLLGGKATVCYYRKECSNFLSIDYNGVINTCGRTLGMKDYEVGDLKKRDLISILGSDEFKRIRSKNSNLPEQCLSCRWLNVCNGGCPLQRNGNNMDRYYFCETMKMILPKMEKRINEFASGI